MEHLLAIAVLAAVIVAAYYYPFGANKDNNPFDDDQTPSPQ